MANPFLAKPVLTNSFLAKPVLAISFLAMAVSAFLTVGATAALADEKKLLDIEPLSSDELLAEKGGSLEGGFQTSVDDPRRRRGTNIRITIEGGQNAVALSSGQAAQTNSTSLRAANNVVNITNIAGATAN